MYRWEQVPRYGMWLQSPRWLIPKVALPQRPSWCHSLYCGEHRVEESNWVEYLLVRVHHPNSASFAIFILDRCPSSKVSIRRLMPSQSISSGSCSPSSPTAALYSVTLSLDGDESKITVDQPGPAETLSTLTRAVQDYDLYWICIDYFKIIQLQYASNRILSTMITV